MLKPSTASKLRKLIQDYADAQEIDSWKGGGDPSEYDVKEEEFREAKKKLFDFIKRHTIKKGEQLSMNIIRNASVYLVGKQVLSSSGIEQFLDDHKMVWKQEAGELTSTAEHLTEFGGRLCYLSFPTPRPGGNTAYLDNIKESKHGSVLEHAVWNFCLTGISRSLSHELVRHRQGVAYSQLSQRYVDESVAEYVEPDIIASDKELHGLWLAAIKDCHDAYVALAANIRHKLDTDASFMAKWANTIPYVHGESNPKGKPTTTELRKLARQAARSVLPNATETKIMFTANARALRHILEQRGSRFAEPEIRKLANQLLGVLLIDSPHIFGDYRTTLLADGTFEIATDFQKV